MPRGGLRRDHWQIEVRASGQRLDQRADHAIETTATFIEPALDIVKSCEGEVGIVFMQCTSLASSVSFGNV